VKMRFEIPLSGEATGLPSSRTAQRMNYHNFCTYCGVWASEHGPGWFQNPVLRRSYAPFAAACTRPFPLQAVRGFEAQRGHGLPCSFQGVVARRCTPRLSAILCVSERLDVATACPKESFDGSRQ
jgi:hypothetical protein